MAVRNRKPVPDLGPARTTLSRHDGRHIRESTELTTATTDSVQLARESRRRRRPTPLGGRLWLGVHPPQVRLRPGAVAVVAVVARPAAAARAPPGRAEAARRARAGRRAQSRRRSHQAAADPGEVHRRRRSRSKTEGRRSRFSSTGARTNRRDISPRRTRQVGPNPIDRPGSSPSSYRVGAGRAHQRSRPD
jgi:hypothetical protein